MKNNQGFVFDTNALVSALLLPGSTPRRAFDKAQDIGTLLLSIETLSELNEVLYREKFNRYLLEEERIKFLALLTRDSDLIEIEMAGSITACRDSNDNKFLEVAVYGKADCIISGDKDLLELHPFRSIPVLKPAEFIQQF